MEYLETYVNRILSLFSFVFNSFNQILFKDRSFIVFSVIFISFSVVNFIINLIFRKEV